ncbi:hypothetical protein SLEP1_g20634 [Rubroshorea leprosula]|uniref:ZF-HD dimerization-type domain-containing protein n=1 Tax=Rubroshorea leprosula TaxID=152421 RepID=A0AAV5J6L0_9ROSI|nr:hypothetical protein SLEP1_g20634 [Rubroshorea leprosula]
MDLNMVTYRQEDADTAAETKTSAAVKYKECMKNHAASIGGHANDGCREFMPLGQHKGRESLACAACGCHRNFHRREVSGLLHYCPSPKQMLMYNVGTAATRQDKNAMNTVPLSSVSHHLVLHRQGDSRDHNQLNCEDRRSETPEREEMNVEGGTRVKRFRTKFTQEQKDRMLEFAERIGWRMHKNNRVALDQFCSEVGIKRNVLKVWMHNNKNSRRRSEPPLEPSLAGPPPPAAASQPVGV